MNDLNGCSLVVAVDVGVNAYIATMDIYTLEAKLYPMPVIEKEKLRTWTGGEKKYIRSKELNEPALRQLLQNIFNPVFPPFSMLTIFEKQAVFPRQGSVTPAN